MVWWVFNASRLSCRDLCTRERNDRYILVEPGVGVYELIQYLISYDYTDY